MPNESQYRQVRWSWRTVLAERYWLKGVSLSCTAVRSNQGKGLGWKKKYCYFLFLFNSSDLAAKHMTGERIFELEKFPNLKNRTLEAEKYRIYTRTVGQPQKM
jgi:hypothetical protein